MAGAPDSIIAEDYAAGRRAGLLGSAESDFRHTLHGPDANPYHKEKLGKLSTEQAIGLFDSKPETMTLFLAGLRSEFGSPVG